MEADRMIDSTHDPDLKSWVDAANDPASGFPIQNLPFCHYAYRGERYAGVGIGDQILPAGDVRKLFTMTRLQRREFRRFASEYLAYPRRSGGANLISQSDVELLAPPDIADYTDFYASIDHATNVGSMFRPDSPLLPNYKWVPIAYHGRASSIVLSGTPIRRPSGQIAASPSGPPEFAPSRRLDYELELGAWIAPGNSIGEPIPIDRAEEHLVGVCLLNDWSARDVQTWEYQPLGPFLAKNFATSISPWIVTLEALEPFRCEAPPHDVGPLSYLQSSQPGAFDITVEAWLKTAKMEAPVRLSKSNFSRMYWTLAQIITHHTSNGCPLRAGDLIGSGTISGPEKHNRGCLLELAWRGTEPVELPSGEKRSFLEDGDEVTLRGYCEREGFRRIGLGECRGTIY